jgi:hypothetical protein
VWAPLAWAGTLVLVILPCPNVSAADYAPALPKF